MKALKYLLITLTVMVFLVVAGLVALVIVIEPNDYKPEIQQFVKDATGRDLIIKGDIGLSVFPWLGLELGEVHLKNAAGFPDNDFAALQAVEIRVALLHLLKTREIQIGVIRLQGLQLNLARKENGVSNWDDLLKADTQQIAPEQQQEPTSSAGRVPLLFVIGGIHVENANIRWQDDQVGLSVNIEKFNFKTGRIKLGETIEFNLDFAAQNQSPRFDATVKLASRLDIDLNAQIYTLSPFDIEAEVRSEELPLRYQRIRLNSAQVKTELAVQQYQIKNAQLSVDAEGADVPKGRQNISINFSADADLAAQTVSLQNVLLKVMGLTVELEATAKNILGEPDANGRITIQSFSPRKLLQELDAEVPVTADAAVLERFSGSMAIDKTQQQLAVTKLDFILDDTRISGNATVEHFATQLALDVHMVLDHIDADRYLPPALETANEQQDEQSGMTGDEPIELPLELMRSIDAKGSLKIGLLKILNLKLQNFEAGLKAKDGSIALNPLNLDLYKGQFRGDVLIDVQTDMPQYSIAMKLTDVDSLLLLDDFTGDSLVEGRLSFASELIAAGNTINKLKQHLNGDVDFAFQDGALKGLNLGEKLREAQAKLRREPYHGEGAKRTDFAAFSGTINLKNGLASFNNTHVNAPTLRAAIKKTANVVTEQLDLRVDLHVVNTKTGQDGKTLNEVKGLYVPIDIKGTFTAPVIDINEKEMLKAWQSDKQQQRLEEKSQILEEKKHEEIQHAQEKLEEKKEELKDKLKKKLKKN